MSRSLQDIMVEKQRKRDEELLVHAQQVQTLLGLTMYCRVIECPECKTKIINPVPRLHGDEDDTRI